MTVETQLLLHRAVSASMVARLRTARIEGESPRPIVGLSMQDELWEALEPALEVAWPDHPSRPDVADLEQFLEEASDRFIKAAKELDGEEDFVPAANFNPQSREMLFEHLRVEVDLIAEAVESEALWNAFENYEPTAAITELVEAGIRIKLRAVGAFLVGGPTRYQDEASASEFFPAGRWEDVRDDHMAQAILDDQKPTHKQVAHLTMTRPLPEERRIYVPASYQPHLVEIMNLLGQFVDQVHPVLIPEWLPAWVEERTPPPPSTLDDLKSGAGGA